MTDQAQVIDPQQDVTLQSLIAQDAPGKASPEEAQALSASLATMSDADLLALVEAAYREDPESNSVLLERASKLLEERGQGKQVKDRLREVRSESWRDLLGEWLGGELYDAIADQTNEAELLAHGKKALDGALDSIVGLSDDLGLDADGSAAVEKLARALAETALAEGNKFLEGEKGQRLLGKVSRWVDDHPGYVLTLAILAAAGAVAADVDLPELKSKFKLGKGFSANTSVDLGSIRNIAFKAAKLDMQYVRGQFKANAGVAYDQEKGVSGSASLRYGDKEDFIQTTGTIDPDGNLIVGLDAALKAGLFTGSTDIDHDVSKGVTTGNIKLRYGTEETFLAGGANLDASSNLKLNLNGGAASGLFTSSFGADYNTDNEAIGANANLRYGSEENFVGLESAYKDESLSASLNARRQLGDNAFWDGNASYKDGQFAAESGTTRLFDGGSNRSYVGSGLDGIYSGNALKYSASGLDLSIDARDYGMDQNIDTVGATLGYKAGDLAQFTLAYGRELDGTQTGSAKARFGDEQLNGELGYAYDGSNSRVSGDVAYNRNNWKATLGATYNLDTSEAERVAVSLGFRDPEEFRAFSVEFAHSVKDGVSEQQIKGMFETQLGQYMVRGTGSATFQEQGVTADASLLGARFVSKDVALIAGGSMRYDGINDRTSFIPQVGVQYKDIPVTVGYDFENQAVTVGLTFRFGR